MPAKVIAPCSNCTEPCVQGVHVDKDHGTALCPKCHGAIYGRRSKLATKHDAVKEKFTGPKKPGVAKLSYINQGRTGPAPTGLPNGGEARAQEIPAASAFEGFRQIIKKHVRG